MNFSCPFSVCQLRRAIHSRQMRFIMRHTAFAFAVFAMTFSLQVGEPVSAAQDILLKDVKVIQTQDNVAAGSEDKATQTKAIVDSVLKMDTDESSKMHMDHASEEPAADPSSEAVDEEPAPDAASEE